MKYQIEAVTFMWFISTYLVPEKNVYFEHSSKYASWAANFTKKSNIFHPVWDRLRPSETVWDRLRPSETVWDRLRPSETVWDRLRPSETVWDRLRPSETVWDRLRPSETVWDRLRPSETVWDRLASPDGVIIPLPPVDPSLGRSPRERKGLGVKVDR